MGCWGSLGALCLLEGRPVAVLLEPALGDGPWERLGARHAHAGSRDLVDLSRFHGGAGRGAEDPAMAALELFLQEFKAMW